jgi:hypothetical protein
MRNLIEAVMLRALISPALIVASIVTLAAPRALALEIRKSGKISVPPDVGVVPFSTDALVANRMRQDFAAEHREADANAATPVTLSVTVNEAALKPGVSLQELAAGDPDVEGLLKAAGATPPPLGDTGTEVDEAALARARAQNHMLPPGATPMQNLMNQLQSNGDLLPPQADPTAGCVPGIPCAPTQTGPTTPPPGTAGYTGDTADYMSQGYEGAGRRARQLSAKDFDNVIVARVSISGSSDEMTIVAVTHPGEDQKEAKELIAEEIVNAVLH